MKLRRLVVLIPFSALAAILVGVMLRLPPPAVNLPHQVTERLEMSGASHPVTAVLLNFRGYDTLLEIGVLLVALIAVIGVSYERGARAHRPGLPLLQMLARLLAPLMVLVAGYLLWAGAHRPGGAFQAGAVLAAAGVLLHLARLLPAWIVPGPGLRVGLTVGFLIFLSVAAALLANGALLKYPPGSAGTLILLIESGLALSLGLVLTGLFLALSQEEEPPR
jgi:multisubunit Na+/H+ antiporter MnhB subunit